MFKKLYKIIKLLIKIKTGTKYFFSFFFVFIFCDRDDGGGLSDDCNDDGGQDDVSVDVDDITYVFDSFRI